MEHGGLMLRVSESLLVEGFDWLNDYFKLGEGIDTKFFNQVLLFSESTTTNPRPSYQDYFIAAVPKAALIVETFEELCKTISSGKMKLKELRLTVTTNENVGSIIVPNITKNIIQSLLDTMTPDYYSAHVINVDISLFVKP
jgi:hypothetical protein